MPENNSWKWAAAAIAAAVLTLSGCGGTEDEKPAITDTADLTAGVALTYDPAKVTEPTHVDVHEGQVLFIAIKSAVAGTVEVKEHDLSQKVVAGEVATLIVSADDRGTFDVRLRGSDVDAVLAEVEVGK